jgi:hypothetical protein
MSLSPMPMPNQTTLSSLDAQALVEELRSRNIVVSVWGPEDLDFLDEDPRTEKLSDAELEAVKLLTLQAASRALVDSLGAAGNETLSRVWRERADSLLCTAATPRERP